MEAYSLRSGSQRIIGYLLKDDDAADGSDVTLAVSKKLLASRLNLEVSSVNTLRRGTVILLEYFWDHAEALETLGLSE